MIVINEEFKKRAMNEGVKLHKGKLKLTPAIRISQLSTSRVVFYIEYRDKKQRAVCTDGPYSLFLNDVLVLPNLQAEAKFEFHL